MMKLMNSETHSWTISLASFAILALFGRLFFCRQADVRHVSSVLCSFGGK